MALDTFLLYLATWTLVALSPGPAVMFAMSQAARHGMRGAVAGTAGILLGHVVVFGAVALGLAALLASYSGAVTTIRIVGALYLMYLGAKMMFSKPRDAANRCRRAGARGARRARAAGTGGAAHESQAAAVRAGVLAAVHQRRLSAAAAARHHAHGDGGDRRHRAAGLRAARGARRARAQGLARGDGWSAPSAPRSSSSA